MYEAYVELKNNSESIREKAIFLIILLIAFTLPLAHNITNILLQFGVILVLIDNVFSNKFKMLMPKSFKFVLFFIIIGWVSLLSAPHFSESLYNFKFVIFRCFFIYWLVLSYVKFSKDIYCVFLVTLISAFFVASYGIYQYYADSILLSTEWVDSSHFPSLKSRVYSTLYNPNILASYLVMITGLVLGGFFIEMKKQNRLWFICLFVLCSLCLLFTFSRGAWVSFFVVIILSSLIFKPKFLFYFMPSSLIALFFMKNLIVERVISTFYELDTSSSLRFAIWESTMAIIKRYPLSGIGWNSFQFVYPEFDFFINDPSVIIYHAHNMYLNIAAELGIPGLIVFLCIFFIHFYYAFIAFKKTTKDCIKVCSAGFCAMLIGVFSCGITDYTLYNADLASIFWFLSALTFAVYNNIEV